MGPSEQQFLRSYMFLCSEPREVSAGKAGDVWGLSSTASTPPGCRGHARPPSPSPSLVSFFHLSQVLPRPRRAQLLLQLVGARLWGTAVPLGLAKV